MDAPGRVLLRAHSASSSAVPQVELRAGLEAVCPARGGASGHYPGLDYLILAYAVGGDRSDGGSAFKARRLRCAGAATGSSAWRGAQRSTPHMRTCGRRRSGLRMMRFHSPALPASARRLLCQLLYPANDDLLFLLPAACMRACHYFGSVAHFKPRLRKHPLFYWVKRQVSGTLHARLDVWRADAIQVYARNVRRCHAGYRDGMPAPSSAVFRRTLRLSACLYPFLQLLQHAFLAAVWRCTRCSSAAHATPPCLRASGTYFAISFFSALPARRASAGRTLHHIHSLYHCGTRHPAFGFLAALSSTVQNISASGALRRGGPFRRTYLSAWRSQRRHSGSSSRCSLPRRCWRDSSHAAFTGVNQAPPLPPCHVRVATQLKRRHHVQPPV